MKSSTLINVQKITTFFWILAVMAYYDNWGPTAHLYLALHGSYGFCWMIKEAAFPNLSFQKEIPLFAVFIVGMILYLPGYWTLPILVLSQREEASPTRQFIATFMYTIGIVTMMVSDCQTYWILKLRPGQLITEGMNRYVRHPNYAGEILLYCSFAVLARRWAAWLILFVGWFVLMLNGIVTKEKSLSRYPAWPQYYSQTGTYFPYIPAVLSGKSIDAEQLALPKKKQ